MSKEIDWIVYNFKVTDENFTNFEKFCRKMMRKNRRNCRNLVLLGLISAGALYLNKQNIIRLSNKIKELEAKIDKIEASDDGK